MPEQPIELDSLKTRLKADTTSRVRFARKKPPKLRGDFQGPISLKRVAARYFHHTSAVSGDCQKDVLVVANGTDSDSNAILPSARDVFQSRRVNCLQPGTAFMIANTASILHLRRARGAISGCFENHVKVVQRVPVNIVFDLSQNPELYCSRESR